MKVIEGGKPRTETTYEEIKSKNEGAGTTAGMSLGEIHVSVRGLVEFILRHGDIDNRHHVSADNAMQEGSRIHRMIQRRMGAEYQAEVPLKIAIPMEKYVLTIEGRADGIIHQDEQVTIDEIKGTYRDLNKMKAPMPLHSAQAKCYAYMYGIGKELKEVRVRLTYCNMPTEQIRYFYEEYTFGELEEWFQALIAAYGKWADFAWEWRRIRQASIEGLEFPYPYREGQKELAANVYWTIQHGRKLFLEAPTGVGKTLTTLYPSVKAVGQGMGEKIFYLTAKTITRMVADDSLELLRGKGLQMKSIILTAKEKICFMEEADCNPEYCPYARGHFERINDAVFDLLTVEDRFERDKIMAYAQKYMVCPFEMSLDLSLFSDTIICDYNYLFDPHVYLKRFFGESSEGKHLFLVDEAHNLLERGREMYSAALVKEDFAKLRRELKKTVMSERASKSKKADILGQMTLDMTWNQTGISENTEEGMAAESTVDQSGTTPWEGIEGSEEWDEELGESCGEDSAGYACSGETGADSTDFGDIGFGGTGRRGSRSILVREGYGDKMMHWLGKCNHELLLLKRECEQYLLVESIDPFVQTLMRLHSVMEDYFSEQEEVESPVRDTLLDFYFGVCHFLDMYELVDENYVKYTQLGSDGKFLLKLFCVNPRENLKNCMARGRSTILFSATFLPIQYYKKLLGGDEEDYEVYARSVFNPAKKALLVASDVTSKYSRRSEEEYARITDYIEEIVKNRHGNYMVFGPSYAFLSRIYEKYVQCYGDASRECIIQEESMNEADREAFLEHFRYNREDSMLVAFCVLGGVFGEGIDLKHDSLIGAIIVGTGMPLVCSEKEILKDYFSQKGESGFDYAYRYPGMNKVLQAAGRVIRTMEDVGIVALLDERFLQFAYRRLFPREWADFETVTVNTVAKKVERFWDEWL